MNKLLAQILAELIKIRKHLESITKKKYTAGKNFDWLE